MVDKSKNIKECSVSVVTIYGAKWHRYGEFEKVYTYFLGYYLTEGSALSATNRYEKRKNFHSKSVYPTKAVKVNEKFYNFGYLPHNEISLVKPSKLESITRGTVTLDLGGGKVIVIEATPLKVKGKLRSENDHETK